MTLLTWLSCLCEDYTFPFFKHDIIDPHRAKFHFFGSITILQAVPLTRAVKASSNLDIGNLCEMMGVMSMDLSASNLSHSCQVWKIRRPWIVRRVRDLNTENEKNGMRYER